MPEEKNTYQGICVLIRFIAAVNLALNGQSSMLDHLHLGFMAAYEHRLLMQRTFDLVAREFEIEDPSFEEQRTLYSTATQLVERCFNLREKYMISRKKSTLESLRKLLTQAYEIEYDTLRNIYDIAYKAAINKMNQPLKKFTLPPRRSIMTQNQTEKKTIHIGCVGESVCYGSFAVPVAEMSYQGQLRKLLGEGFEVHDYAAPGAPFLPEMAWPWSHHGYIGSSQGYRSAQRANDIYLILLGNNDSKVRVWDAPTGGEENFRIKVKELVDLYRNLPSNPKIYLMLAPPAFSPESGKKTYQIRDDFLVSTINPLLRELSEELDCGLIDLRSLFPDPNTEEGFAELEKLYGEGDGVHPNNDGYTLIAKHLYEVLKKDLNL